MMMKMVCSESLISAIPDHASPASKYDVSKKDAEPWEGNCDKTLLAHAMSNMAASYTKLREAGQNALKKRPA